MRISTRSLLVLWISCGHTTPPLVRVQASGYTYEVCGGRRCQALLPKAQLASVPVEPVRVPFAPYDSRATERQLAAA